jgi:hypothetical protein
MWRAWYNYQLYKLFNEPDIIKVIKVNLLKLLLQLFGMQEQSPYRKLTVHKTGGYLTCMRICCQVAGFS